VDIVVRRDDGTETLTVTLGRREDADAAGSATEPEDEAPLQGNALGMDLSPLTGDLRQEYGIDAGIDGLVVTSVDAASEAAGKNIARGDVIAEAGQQKVMTLQDLQDRIAEARDAG